MTSILAPTTKQYLAVGDSVRITGGGYSGNCGKITVANYADDFYTIYLTTGMTVFGYPAKLLEKTQTMRGESK